MSSSRFSSTKRHWVLGTLLAGVLVWLLFFDSHSLLKRYQWHRELATLETENDTLRRDIEELQHRIDRPLSDSAVKHIAREEYDMKRSDERIHHLEAP